MWRKMATLGIWTILVLLNTNVSAPAAELTKLRVGILIAGEFGPTYIALKKGFFEKNGLAVELVYFQGGSQAVQGMLANNVPLIVTAGPEGVVAKIQGADILLLSTNNPTLAFTLFVSPDIKKPEDLRGKKAGISRFGSSSDHSIKFMFQKLGLMEKEVTVVEMGDNPTRLAALTTKTVHASVFGVPYSVAVQKAGFPAMLEGHKLGLKFQGSGIATTSAFLREQRPVVEQFFKGFLEGVHFAKTHREESVQLIKEFLKLKDDDEAEETYRVIVQEIQPRKPYPLKEGIETVLRIVEKTVPKAKDANPEEIINDSVIKKIDESGFIDKLYK
jgi:NitT/TauT family transport system substrate-binding protein